MRHILMTSYVLSILFLGWILYASVISIDSSILSRIETTTSYSPAFAPETASSFGASLFGSVKNMMIIISSVGLTIQIPAFIKMLKTKEKKDKKRSINSTLLYSWLGLFSPYIVLLFLIQGN